MSSSTKERSNLAVDGMHCAACAARIETELGKLDGVQIAQVNYATGKANVMHEARVKDDALVATIEGLGYGVIEHDEADEAEDRREADLWRRFVLGAVLSVPAMLIGMLPAYRFDGWA